MILRFFFFKLFLGHSQKRCKHGFGLSCIINIIFIGLFIYYIGFWLLTFGTWEIQSILFFLIYQVPMLLRIYHILVPFFLLFLTPLSAPPPLWFWWFKFQREVLLLLPHPIHPHGRLFDWHHSFPKSPFKIVFFFHFFFHLQPLWPTCILEEVKKPPLFFYKENLKQIFRLCNILSIMHKVINFFFFFIFQTFSLR